MPSPDLVQGNFTSPQTMDQQTPVTMESAVNVIPTTKLTFFTGTASLAAIGTVVAAVSGGAPKHIDPVQWGYHELVFIFTNAAPGVFTVTAYPDGNIKTAYQPIQNRAVILFYDPTTHLYWAQSVT